MYEKGFEDLCNQVVQVAMQDLRRANKQLQMNPNSIGAQARYDEVTNFFRSEWLGQFTELDGEWLIKMSVMDKVQLKQLHYNVGAEGKKRGGGPKKNKEVKQ